MIYSSAHAAFDQRKTRVVMEATDLLEQLAALTDLNPSPLTNRLFGSLVALTRRPLPWQVQREAMAELAADGRLSALHGLCAAGESALEIFWADKLMGAADPAVELRFFPYLREYEDLVAEEFRLLRQVAPTACKVLFVGSGPLPLSAWLLATRYGLDVTLLDVCSAAHGWAQGWMRRLPGHEKLHCDHGNIFALSDLGTYDAVIVGALVGTAGQKPALLAHLRAAMRPGQPLLIRSVRGLRGLLYPEVGEMVGFKAAGVYHPGPTTPVINSVLVGLALAA